MSGAKEDDQSVSNGMSTAAEVAGGYTVCMVLRCKMNFTEIKIWRQLKGLFRVNNSMILVN